MVFIRKVQFDCIFQSKLENVYIIIGNNKNKQTRIIHVGNHSGNE